MYRKNVTDKEQEDLESAINDSGIPVYVRRNGVGQKLILPAYDLQAQGAHAIQNNASLTINREHMAIGNHNDKFSQFLEPGR